MAILQPITELNEDIRGKATATILALEAQWEGGDSTLIWNNLFFRNADGSYYATFHDIADDTGYPYWLRSEHGTMHINLWWVDGEIIATGDLTQEEDEFGAGGGLVDSGNRVWMRTGPQTLEPDPDIPRNRHAPTIQPQSNRSPTLTEESLHPGQRVRHATFGEGTVVSSRRIEGDQEVTIRFLDQTRRLLASFARLQRLD